MKSNVIVIFIVGLLFLCTPPAESQSLVINFKDGTTNTAMLNKLQNLSFSQSNLLEKFKSGSVNTYSLATIRKLTFGSSPAPVSQAISLLAGWNSLSGYIMPDETNIATLLAPISPELIIIQNTTQMYYPAGGINTIVNWNSQSAYNIKLSQNADFLLSGQPETNKTIQLTAGWNLIPIISSNTIDVATLFSGFGANLLIVQEAASNKIYWPEYSINTIEALQPGKAYLVKVNNPAVLTFP